MKRSPSFFFALAAACSALACSSRPVVSSTTGGSGGSGSGGGAFAGPASWNRQVTPPADADATAQRAACGYKAGSLPAETQGASHPSGSAIPVDHIIVVMMENRSFDHYYWKLPENGQTDVEVAPAGYTNPDGMGGTVAPFHDNRFCFVDTNHEWTGSHDQYDSGKMDGFFATNNNYGMAPAHPLSDSLSGARALSYYDNTDIPFYYWLANEFSIADHYHCSLLGPTWPNRMYMYGSSSRGATDNVLISFDDQKGACMTDADCGGKPGSCYGATPQTSGGCLGTCKVDADCGVDAQEGACDVSAGGICHAVGRTLFDYMEQRQLDWKVYATSTPGFGLIIGTWLKYHVKHQFTIQDYFNDAAAGTLPSVAFVDPDLANEIWDGQDEHPPGMPQGGQHWSATVIDALTKSPAWGKSALFLTYDEHGGLWDHVPPPAACPPDSIAPVLKPNDTQAGFDRYGVRVPMMVVSPFAKKHFVAHHTYDHTSIVRFIQARFVLPAITARDANAEAPWEMFDFTSSPPPHATPPAITVPDLDQAGLTACQAVFVQ